jgi:hypothetical protein
MARARGEFIAIFDADFLPDASFLQSTVPFFTNPDVGLVQTRWGHLNREHSALTRAQGLAIDGHFGIEQAGRCWSGWLLNFNGTAGIWRRKAIEDAGGWQADTLTEDLDLSYRAQLAGWRIEYAADVEVPAEIPADITAFKSQQRRWAKGSIQTAKKLLPRVWRSGLPLTTRIQATLHLTHYLVHPLMLLVALLAAPVLLSGRGMPLSAPTFALAAALLLLGTCGPTTLYITAQRALRTDWRKRLVSLARGARRRGQRLRPHAEAQHDGCEQRALPHRLQAAARHRLRGRGGGRGLLRLGPVALPATRPLADRPLPGALHAGIHERGTALATRGAARPAPGTARRGPGGHRHRRCRPGERPRAGTRSPAPEGGARSGRMTASR